MQLSIFVLNARSRKLYQISRYIRELGDFIEFVLHSRYGLEIETQYIYPKLRFETYADVQAYDKLDVRNTGKGLQLYIGYGLQLNPHGELAGKGSRSVGVCECVSKKELSPLDMMYIDMTAYDLGAFAFMIKSIYHFFEQSGRVALHELEHQVLRLLGDRGYVTKVHKAANAPIEIWQKSALGYIQVLHDIALQSKNPYFVIQPDPRPF